MNSILVVPLAAMSISMPSVTPNFWSASNWLLDVDEAAILQIYIYKIAITLSSYRTSSNAAANATTSRLTSVSRATVCVFTGAP